MNHVLVTIVYVFFSKSYAIRLPNARIIGGGPIDIKDCSYQLSIVIKKSTGSKLVLFKGAAIIVSKYWAFTAANNIAYIDNKLFDIGFVFLRGNVTKWSPNQHANDHKVINTYSHPEYKTYSRDYNLALVHVDKEFNALYEKPIKVVGKQYQYRENTTAMIVGWGKVSTDQKGPTEGLRAARVSLVNQKRCIKLYSQGFRSPLTPRMVCAYHHGRDTCAYDSGGPMVSNDTLLAVISLSRTCATSSLPGIYTKVSEFYDWIKSLEKKNKLSLNITFVPK